MPTNKHEARRGVWHAKSTDELLAFRAIPAAEKLRWLEVVRQTLNVMPAELQAKIQRFRDREI
jgi:hypothetical protein